MRHSFIMAALVVQASHRTSPAFLFTTAVAAVAASMPTTTATETVKGVAMEGVASAAMGALVAAISSPTTLVAAIPSPQAPMEMALRALAVEAVGQTQNRTNLAMEVRAR